jgi:inner membrane protein
MASLGHLAIGLVAARAVTPEGAPRRQKTGRAVALMALSMLPDADVVMFLFGFPYEHPLGHRGASHSFAFALAIGVLAGAVARGLGRSGWRVGLVVAAVVASHPILDAFTDGGLGCALYWPFDVARYFWPWRPIPVAPIGLGYLSARGMQVGLTELLFFLPCWAYAFWPRPPAARAAEASSGGG